MTKSIFEQLGGAYEQQGDYLLPCLTVPAENEQPIGVWGQRHLQYLKEYRRAAYITLLTSGRLNAYLADIDRQAQERMERLTEQMKQAQGITEQLKVENTLEWVGRMNNIRACEGRLWRGRLFILKKCNAYNCKTVADRDKFLIRHFLFAVSCLNTAF